MSTRTLVTKTSTVLTAIQRPSSTVLAGHFNAADIAAINALIKYDYNTNLPAYQSLSPNGLMVIPGQRGYNDVKPGYVLAVDLNGWPIIISAESIAANNAWTLT